jgi:hypothetical protein
MAITIANHQGLAELNKAITNPMSSENSTML